MTQTATVSTTATIFPIDSVIMAGVKSQLAGEKSMFSLHAGGRVRITSHSFNAAILEVLELSQSEVKKVLAWLTELDVRGLLQAEPEPNVISAHGTVQCTITYIETRNYTFDLFYDRCVAIHSKHDYRRNLGRVSCAKLSQAETIALLAWLQEQQSVKQDLH